MNTDKKNHTRSPSRIVGYYNYNSGARYFSPVHLGIKFPDLVESHESFHELLSTSNFTDGIGRIFTSLMSIDGNNLTLRDRLRIKRLLKTIHRHTILTHEIVATYLSFLFFGHFKPNDLADARTELPQFYAEALKIGETAFGEVTDARTLSIISVLPTVVMTTAIAALNIPTSTGLLSFSKLGDCSTHIKVNAPDHRFRHILAKIRPHWDNESALQDVLKESNIKAYELGTEEDQDQFQMRVFGVLRKILPSLDFQTYWENPLFLRNVLASVVSDGIARGYAFLRSMEIVPHSAGALPFGANVMLPGVPRVLPTDISLAILKYIPTSLDILSRYLDDCVRDRFCLIGHIVTLHHKDIDQVAIFYYAIQRNGTLALPPFAVLDASLEHLSSTLRTAPNGSVLIKLDERTPKEIVRKITHIGHPVFILLHDIRPQHLISVLSEYQGKNIIRVVRFRLKSGDDSYSVFVGKVENDTIHYVAPLTAFGKVLIERSGIGPHGVGILSDEEAQRVYGPSLQFIQHMIFWCYAATQANAGEFVNLEGLPFPQQDSLL